MSSSAHATVVKGVLITFEKTLDTICLSRYDSKTGKPTTLTTKSYRIEATCGCQTVTLPEDDLAYEEEHGGYLSFSSWIWDRTASRIYNWLHDHGIHEEGKFKRFSRIDMEIVGVCVAETNSSEPPVEVDIQKLPEIREALNDVLSNMFKAPVNCNPSLYLITKIT